MWRQHEVASATRRARGCGRRSSALLQRQHLRAHEPRRRRPGRDPDHEDDVADRRARAPRRARSRAAGTGSPGTTRSAASARAPVRPAVEAGGDPDDRSRSAIASTVAARPTSRLMREPQTSCVQTLRPRLSVPSGGNSRGLAHGRVVGRVDGAAGPPRRRAAARASAISDEQRPASASPIIPARLRRYCDHAPAERAAPAQPRDPPRRRGAATLLMPYAPAGRARRRAGRRAG